MDDLERYHFDLHGYIHVKGILSKAEVAQVLAATNTLEDKFVSRVSAEPKYNSLNARIEYHYDSELGTSTYEANHGGGGPQYVVDDVLNADPAFDVFVGHEPTLTYVRELAESPLRIVSSELRYRHQGNITGTHMGGPIDSRNRYVFVPPHADGTPHRHFDLLAVRVLYALHDIPVDNGPLCVVPGSHKSNLQSPYGKDPLQEPGMIPLPMEAGDVLFFTENLRHGGYPNVIDRVRKTVHICYAPAWVGSQSPAHWGGEVFVKPEAWARYSERQRALLPAPMLAPSRHPEQMAMNRLIHEVEYLREKNEQLKEAIEVLTSRKGRLRRLLNL